MQRVYDSGMEPANTASVFAMIGCPLGAAFRVLRRARCRLDALLRSLPVDPPAHKGPPIAAGDSIPPHPRRACVLICYIRNIMISFIAGNSTANVKNEVSLSRRSYCRLAKRRTRRNPAVPRLPLSCRLRGDADAERQLRGNLGRSVPRTAADQRGLCCFQLAQRSRAQEFCRRVSRWLLICCKEQQKQPGARPGYSAF